MIKYHKTSIQTDQRGKITTGDRDEKGLPRKLGYFNISKFPELIQMYGDKPSKLIIVLPGDRIEDCYDDRFVLWAGGGKPGAKATKVRECDGETCLHRLEETFGADKYGRGEETPCICKLYGLADHEKDELRKKACKAELRLKAFVADPKTAKVKMPLPIRFESHSVYSANAIHTALENMAGLTSMLAGQTKLQMMAMSLTVDIKESRNDPRITFPLWSLAPIGSILDIRNRMIMLAKNLGWDAAITQRLIAQEPPPEALVPAPAKTGVALIDEIFPEHPENPT